MMPGICMAPCSSMGKGEVLITSGSTWRVPSNFSPINSIECTGGGGGGGGPGSSGGHSVAGGGGGGGGGFSKINNLWLAPASDVPISIGPGGFAGPENAPGGNGGDTWFKSAGTVAARGGKGGPYVNTPDTGAPAAKGGQASSGIGTTKFSGGDGGELFASMTGGGGAAGPDANGGNGLSGSFDGAHWFGGDGGPAGGGDGGKGGDAGDELGADSLPGSNYGGGGAGGTFHSDTARAPGAPGAPGAIRVKWGV